MYYLLILASDFIDKSPPLSNGNLYVPFRHRLHYKDNNTRIYCYEIKLFEKNDRFGTFFGFKMSKPSLIFKANLHQKAQTKTYTHKVKIETAKKNTEVRSVLSYKVGDNTD